MPYAVIGFLIVSLNWSAAFAGQFVVRGFQMKNCDVSCIEVRADRASMGMTRLMVLDAPIEVVTKKQNYQMTEGYFDISQSLMIATDGVDQYRIDLRNGSVTKFPRISFQN